jgi:hypothetical protein
MAGGWKNPQIVYCENSREQACLVLLTFDYLTQFKRNPNELYIIDLGVTGIVLKRHNEPVGEKTTAESQAWRRGGTNNHHELRHAIIVAPRPMGFATCLLRGHIMRPALLLPQQRPQASNFGFISVNALWTGSQRELLFKTIIKMWFFPFGNHRKHRSKIQMHDVWFSLYASMSSVARSDASEEAVGDDSKVMCLHASHPSHGVAQVAIYSHVASQETGVGNVHDVEMAMYSLSTSTACLHS